MTINRKLTGGLGVAALVTGIGSASAAAAPPSTEPPVPPVAVEEFTSVDGTTLRGGFTDSVAATITLTREGMDPITVDIADASSIAVTRMTFQPGAQAPWHTHNGPVLVSVIEGELTYVMADGCSQHSYPAGSAFVDPGHGNVHSGYNPTDGLTVVVNTFLEAPADGPLSITEGITAPADNCGLPTPAS